MYIGGSLVRPQAALLHGVQRRCRSIMRHSFIADITTYAIANWSCSSFVQFARDRGCLGCVLRTAKCVWIELLTPWYLYCGQGQKCDLLHVEMLY